jgi:3-dehydroquinate dehydratase/shikimate dehydrogenase
LIVPTQISQVLRARIGKVCVAIIGSTAAEMVEKANAVVRETPFLEFRLDYLEKPLLALPKLKEFLTEHAEATAIATCRRTANGGKFAGNLAAELDVLMKAAGSGFYLVDLELESAEEAKKGELEKLRETGAALIVSYHDFKATQDLDAIYERIKPFAPEFAKIVPTAKTLTDNVTLMRFLERVSDSSNIIGTCMGDAGVISRVLGVRAGSAFTFAAATQGEETAPGQIAARTLLETYRIDQVDAATKVYGVVGNPVRHSLSPMMMNTAFRRETVNAVYLALQTADLKDLVRLAHEIPLQGLSVTMPFKQDIMQYLEKTDPLSQKIGACNTVLRAQDGNLYGFNTDVSGITSPLEKRMSLRGAKILVLGAGGSARAAVFGLKEKGAEVHILNRTVETAQKLARQAGAKVFKREALAKTTFDVIVNATPVGMAGNKGAALLDAKELNASLVYNPLETPLIRMARQKGIPFVTGLEMFVQQGARQFEIWTGKPAPAEEMLRVVLHALRQQQESVAAEAPARAAGTEKVVAAKEAAPVKTKATPVKVTAAPAKGKAVKRA